MLDAPDHAAMIDRITNAKFGTTELKPGYDEKEVDDFLDQVMAQLRSGGLPEVGGAWFSVTRNAPRLRPARRRRPAARNRPLCGTSQVSVRRQGWRAKSGPPHAAFACLGLAERDINLAAIEGPIIACVEYQRLRAHEDPDAQPGRPGTSWPCMWRRPCTARPIASHGSQSSH